MSAVMELAKRMPVGARVRHETGWVGVVSVDDPTNPASLNGQRDSHCLHGLTPLVCVSATLPSCGLVKAWYNPRVLWVTSEQPTTGSSPAPRKATAPQKGGVRRG